MSTQVARPGKHRVSSHALQGVKDLYILGDVSELIAALDESSYVNTVLGSRYAGDPGLRGRLAQEFNFVQDF